MSSVTKSAALVAALTFMSPALAFAQSAPPAPPAPTKADAQAKQVQSDPNFEAMMNSLVPLSPDQVKTYREKKDATDKAKAAPVNGPIKSMSRQVDLTLKPGEAAPMVRMAGGHVSTLTFSDVTGAPWPVLSVTAGNPKAYDVQAAGKTGDTNIIVVTPLTDYASSNLVVTLVGHPVPILVELESGQKEVDYRVDMRIAARGPNATYDLSGTDTLPPTNDGTMMAFLDGVPPDGASNMKTSNSNVEAWRYDDNLYIRTPLSVLSPAFLGKSSNVSGVNVYEMHDAPVLIVSDSGVMRTVYIEE